MELDPQTAGKPTGWFASLSRAYKLAGALALVGAVCGGLVWSNSESEKAWGPREVPRDWARMADIVPEPTPPEPAHRRVWLLQRDGKLDQALALADEALAADPTDALLLKRRVLVQLEREDHAGAQADLEALIALKPREDGLLVWSITELAETQATLGDLEGALAHYDEVLAMEPYSSVFLARGRLKAKLGDPDGALADYSRSIKDGGDGLLERGLLYTARGEFAKAQQDLEILERLVLRSFTRHEADVKTLKAAIEKGLATQVKRGD